MSHALALGLILVRWIDIYIAYNRIYFLKYNKRLGKQALLNWN